MLPETPAPSSSTIQSEGTGWGKLHSHFRPYVERLNRSYYVHNPLVQEFNHFLETHEFGYFAVEAEPGMGKSAFAAWVTTREKRCAAHFVELGSGANETATVVRSVGAQLINSWELHDLAPGGVLSRDSGDPAWLAMVIEAAADRRDRIESEARIVIVVDAVEAAREQPAHALPFGLPEHLPRGVFVVITARSGQLRSLPPAQHYVRQRPDMPENRAALRGFLHLTIRDDIRIAQALSEYGVAEERFVDDLLKFSAGSWVYVHYVLKLIELDPAAVRNVPRLPSGLGTFYDHCILPLCRESADQEPRVALLAALGAAGEPLDADGLCSLAGVSGPALVDRLMQDGLQPFCDVTLADDDPSGRPLYALHHASLREYLSGSPSVTISDADARLRERIARACRSAHGRICDRYLNPWDGLGCGLSALVNSPELADVDG